MRVLILLSCAFAATSGAYLGPYHYPVIGPNGVPVEPAEVQAERGRHFAALAATRGHNPYFGHYAVPALHHNALPLDAPEVAAAKLQHFRDYAAAAHRNGVATPAAYTHAAAIAAIPADTPEVQLAKAAHFAAHAEAASRNSGHFHHYRRKRDVYGGYHIPVIGPNGVPVEPIEVQAARANHLAALSQAASRAVPAYHAGYYGEPAPAATYSAPQHSYDGPRYYGPPAQIGPDGQPVETPEVRAAKAYHLAAHSALRTGHYGHF